MSKQKKHQLTAEILTIVSSDGKPRALLTTNPVSHMPVFQLLANEGARFVITLGPNGSPLITMLRQNGIQAVTLCVDKNETGIGVSYPNGAPALRIDLPASGTIKLEVYGVDGTSIKLDGPSGP